MMNMPPIIRLKFNKGNPLFLTILTFLYFEYFCISIFYISIFLPFYILSIFCLKRNYVAVEISRGFAKFNNAQLCKANIGY